jgi:hypothetical protein
MAEQEFQLMTHRVDRVTDAKAVGQSC